MGAILEWTWMMEVRRRLQISGKTKENYHHEDCLPFVSDGQGAGQGQRNKEETGEPWGCRLRNQENTNFLKLRREKQCWMEHCQGNRKLGLHW